MGNRFKKTQLRSIKYQFTVNTIYRYKNLNYHSKHFGFHSDFQWTNRNKMYKSIYLTEFIKLYTPT